MAGDIALIGGEEFRRGCEDMDREIMRSSGQSPARVVIIPTAAITGPAKAANDGVTHFAKLGGDSSQLMVLDRAQSDDLKYASSIEQAGVIYFTGGSPEHLLATLQDSRLLDAILKAVDHGTVLAGSSAGAMVMGSVMKRPSGGPWSEALDIVPGIIVLPHHERRDPAQTLGDLGTLPRTDITLLGIDARAGCLGRPGNWRVVGSGNVTVYKASDWAVYRPGETLPKDV